MSLPVCQIICPGIVEYSQALEWQRTLAQAVHDGRQPNTLLLLEHPHVYTTGRLSLLEHILLTPAQLADQGMTVYETDRGGQVTYHGPGQLVGYPIIDLRNWGGPVKYVRTLERVLVDTLADFGISAGVIDGLTGVWVDNAKIAAIGVRISRGVTMHGFALNVNTNLSYFRHIIPCGIGDRPVTSMAQQLGNPVDMEATQYSAAYHLGHAMGFRMVETEKVVSLLSPTLANS